MDTIEISKIAGQINIEMTRSATIHQIHSIYTTIRDAVKNDKTVILDLSRLNEIDFSFLQLTLSLKEFLKERLVIKNPPVIYTQMIQAAGFERYFPIGGSQTGGNNESR
jgi:hypothetical protein